MPTYNVAPAAMRGGAAKASSDPSSTASHHWLLSSLLKSALAFQSFSSDVTQLFTLPRSVAFICRDAAAKFRSASAHFSIFLALLTTSLTLPSPFETLSRLFLIWPLIL